MHETDARRLNTFGQDTVHHMFRQPEAYTGRMSRMRKQSTYNMNTLPSQAKVCFIPGISEVKIADHTFDHIKHNHQ